MAAEQAIDKISTRKIQEFYSLFYSCFVSFRISFLAFSHPCWHSRKRECWEDVAELPGNMALWGLSTLIADFMPLSRSLVSYVYIYKASSPFLYPPYVIFFIPRKRTQNMAFESPPFVKNCVQNELANDPLTCIRGIPYTEWMRGKKARKDYAFRYTLMMML